MSVKVVAPVRCPHCRRRLTTKLLGHLGWIRWCKRCRCTVSYVEADDGWIMAGHYDEHGFR